MPRALFAVVIALLALQGCATKIYGRSGVLTDYEKTEMSCREIDLETARTHGFIEQVNQESKFSVRDVFAILGDLGIGNYMEKTAALESAQNRIAQLRAQGTAKGCNSVASR